MKNGFCSFDKEIQPNYIILTNKSDIELLNL